LEPEIQVHWFLVDGDVTVDGGFDVTVDEGGFETPQPTVRKIQRDRLVRATLQLDIVALKKAIDFELWIDAIVSRRRSSLDARC
jgi:hypothetical protein